jgi:hypothetical protein
MKTPTLARVALIVSLLLPVYFAVAALGVKFGAWPWQFGLGVMIIQAGLPVLGVALLLALAALVLSLVRRPRRGWAPALAALVIPLAALGYLASVRAKTADIPPIHDVSTDIADPPRFSAAVLAARSKASANPVAAMDAPLASVAAYQGPAFRDLGSRTLGEVGRSAYPKVRTLTVPAPQDAAFAAALKAAEAQGWRIITQDRARGVIEATAETFWFGFKDDVAIRLRPAGGGVAVDVRSTSRVGLSDIGANAARIEAYLADLAKRLAAA